MLYAHIPICMNLPCNNGNDNMAIHSKNNKGFDKPQSEILRRHDGHGYAHLLLKRKANKNRKQQHTGCGV